MAFFRIVDIGSHENGNLAAGQPANETGKKVLALKKAASRASGNPVQQMRTQIATAESGRVAGLLTSRCASRLELCRRLLHISRRIISGNLEKIGPGSPVMSPAPTAPSARGSFIWPIHFGKINEA